MPQCDICTNEWPASGVFTVFEIDGDVESDIFMVCCSPQCEKLARDIRDVDKGAKQDRLHESQAAKGIVLKKISQTRNKEETK